MAPVATLSRPPGRPKMRSKVDGRLGSPALYTARNLDRCTRQLGHWNPFSCSATASLEQKLGDSVPEGIRSRVDLHSERNPNLGNGTENAHPVLVSAFRSVAVASPDSGRTDHRYQQAEPQGGLRTDTLGEPAPDWMKLGSGKSVFEFGKLSTTAECPGQERRAHGWSKHRKQLSHALARGLWRWKDGFHARKRMKRCGPGGGRNSGSDRSSDRAPYGVHASDPSTAPTSKAGPFKWSDFPVTPTDSSGELFGGGSANLMTEMNALGKDWTACGCVRAAGADDTRTDCDQCWLGVDNQNALESGYGSEPGYRGDEELEFGDIDEEQDEEEVEPQHLRRWTQVIASHRSSGQENHLDMHEANGQAMT